MPELDPLVTKIETNLKEFERDMKRAADVVEKTDKKMADDLKQTGAVIDRNFKTLAAKIETNLAGGGKKAGGRLKSGILDALGGIEGDIGNILSAGLAGGAVGAGVAAVTFAVNGIIDIYREGREAIAEMDETLADFDVRALAHAAVIGEVRTALDQYNGLLMEGADILGIVEGDIDAATGKLRTFGAELANDLVGDLDPVFIKINLETEGLVTELATLQRQLDDFKAGFQLPEGVGNNDPLFQTGDQNRLIEGFEKRIANVTANIQRLNDERQRARAIQSALQDGADEAAEANRERFETEQRIITLTAEGNDKKARDLRDQLDLEKLVSAALKAGITDAEAFAEAQIKRRRAGEDAEAAEKAAVKAERERAKLARESAREVAAAVRERQKQLRIEERALKANLNAAAELFKAAQTPLDAYVARLSELSALEANPVTNFAAGGEETFQSARADAVVDLARQTDDYRVALDELIKLQEFGRISADDFAQAYKEILAPVETLTQSLDRLNGIAKDSGISGEAVRKTADAIKDSAEFAEQVNEDKIQTLEILERELEMELEIARLRGADIDVAGLERRLAITRETIDLMRLGVSEGQAQDQAETFVNASEEERARERARAFFREGVRAAFEGDFKEFASKKLEEAANNMFDNALDNLFDSLTKNLGPLITKLFGDGGAGGGGGLFAGLFADGGNIPSGQFGIVGEAGPELVTGPATVFSNADSRRILSSSGKSGGVSITFAPQVDARGADQAAVARLGFELNRQRQELKKMSGDFVPRVQQYLKDRERGVRA